MIPNQSDTDLSNLCSQILRQVEKLHLNGIDPDNWVHLA